MKKIILPLILLLLLCQAACQRNSLPYGGVDKDDNAPKYSEEVNVNKQKP